MRLRARSCVRARVRWLLVVYEALDFARRERVSAQELHRCAQETVRAGCPTAPSKFSPRGRSIGTRRLSPCLASTASSAGACIQHRARAPPRLSESAGGRPGQRPARAELAGARACERAAPPRGRCESGSRCPRRARAHAAPAAAAPAAAPACACCGARRRRAASPTRARARRSRRCV